MPFGLDTPSTIGMAILVLGPAYAKFRAAGLDPTSAGLETWYLGMAATASMGILKFLLVFAGRTVRRVIPMAGLLGSLAGIALTLIGFFPMIDLLQFPMIGLLTLGLVLYALVAKGSAPFGMPGVLFAVIAGTAFYYGAGHCGFLGQIPAPAMPTLRLAFPHPDAGLLHGLAGLGGYPALSVIVALGNGFIITATIWAAFVAEMIERRLRSAAVYLAVGGVLCFFGIVHSVRLDGSAYVLPQLDGLERNAAIQFCAAYFLLAGSVAAAIAAAKSRRCSTMSSGYVKRVARMSAVSYRQACRSHVEFLASPIEHRHGF
jgi:hypothetical protein